MRHKLFAIALLLLLSTLAFADGPTGYTHVLGTCMQGNNRAVVQGIQSTNLFQASYPRCQVSVYFTGTQSLVSLVDINGAPAPNPFTAATDGSWAFYGPDSTQVDIVMSGGTPIAFPQPVTLADVYISPSGGGGGGLTPCGSLYDIQSFLDPAHLGCDTGIGILDTTQHLISENILNANQQVDVSDATNSGLMCLGHSTGTAADSAYCIQPSNTFSPTPTGGYGIFPPDNAPTALGQAVEIANTTPVNVVTKYGTLPFYRTQYGNPNGAVSLENLPYIFTDTPCNSPSTCSDLAPTPVPYAPSVSFMGPPQNTGNLGYVTNTATAQDATGSLSHAVITLPNTYTTGDTLVAMVTNDSGGSVATPIDTCGNTWTAVYAVGGQGVWYAANSVKCTTADVITINLGAAGGFIAEAGEVVNGGILDTSVQGGSCSGASPYTITYSSLTTAQPDILVVMENQQGIAGGPFGTYAPGSGFTVESQATHYGGGGLGASRSMMIEWGPANSAGAHNATATFTLGSGGTSCNVTDSFTLAFKPIVSTLPGNPAPRLERKTDLEQSGDFPPTASGDSGKPLIVDPTGTKYILGATAPTGTSIQFQNNGTNFGSPLTGAGSMNFVNCTVSGTTPNFTITCTGSAPAFSAITSGTNTTAAMVVGAGASLDYNSTGTIDANKVNGATVATSATVAATNSSGQVIAATYQGNGAKAQLSTGTTTTNDCVKFDANGNTVDAGAACGSGSGSPTFPVNSQTTTYTATAADFAACKTIVAPSGGFTITLVASGSQPPSGQCIWIFNYDSGGAITVSRNGQNINGSTNNFTIPNLQSALIVSDGTNYIAQRFVNVDYIKGNVAIGPDPNTTVNNVLIGFNAAGGGGNEVIIGNGAGQSFGGSHTNNVIIGDVAGSGTFSSSQNVIVGATSCPALNGSDICIGYSVSSSNGLGSNDILIGNGSNIQAAGGANNYLNIGNFLYGDMSKGILILQGATTVVSACGTSPSLASGSNDMTGEVTTGSASPTSCTVSFANTHNKAPFCVVSPQTTGISGFAYSVSTTALTVTATSGFSSVKFDYFCPAGTTTNNPTP